MHRPTLALAILILCGAATFVWWIDRPNVRYAFVGGGWECSVRQFMNLPSEQIDMIAIGSSRVRAGLDLNLVASLSNGEVQSAYNFSRTGISAMRNYVLFRDLLEKGIRLKYAYVEIDTEAFLKERDYQLGVYRDVGFLKFSDLRHLYHAYPSASLSQRIHTVAANSMKKVGDALILVLSGRVSEANAGSEEEAPHVCWRPYYDTKTPRKEAAIAKRRAEFEERYGDIWTVEYDVVQDFETASGEVETYGFNLIRELAADNDVVLVSGRHWRAYEPPISQASLSALQERFPEFIHPDHDFVRSTWGDYVDTTHMFAGSRERFSRWLAEQVFAPEVRR